MQSVFAVTLSSTALHVTRKPHRLTPVESCGFISFTERRHAGISADVRDATRKVQIACAYRAIEKEELAVILILLAGRISIPDLIGIKTDRVFTVTGDKALPVTAVLFLAWKDIFGYTGFSPQ